METHLTTYKLLKYVNEDLAKDADDDDQSRDSLALSQIHQAIDMSVFVKISTAKTAKQVWDILDKTYRDIDIVQRNNLMVLKRKFEGCMMEKTKTIEAYFSRLMEIKNEMELNGYEVEDEMFVEKVLNSLPLKFDYIVAVLDNPIMVVAIHMLVVRILELVGVVAVEITKVVVKMDSANSIMTPAEERLRLTKDGNDGVVNSIYFKSLVGSLSKHIDIKYHFIRDLVRENEIAVNYCKSEDQVTNIFTKGLKMETFMKLKKMLGMENVANLV
ncbi:hypothetical protein ZIOFF_000640 [Zingiber officinale]|uniref:Uncharacterized protein n=1 Tax=Zingiber officinale TaxID=94328 RepID=A0A8J5I4S6_ZINOF|nr:hypothetical protein ZIOFF_000640 [Zingiber officinale]